MAPPHANKRVSIISISGRMKIPPNKPKAWFGCRHVQVLLMSFGFLCCYAVRVTMSVALEAMTDASTANPGSEEFPWDDTIKDVILSSFFWGYVCTQIPGSVVAQSWSAQKLFSITVVLCGLVTLSVPLAAHYGDWQAVCASRVLAGLFQGTVLPTLHCLLSKWSPIEERGRLATFVYSAGWIGNVISFLSCGMLSGSPLGWPSCFYFWGGVTVFAGVIFFFIGKESPAEHPSIPHDEKEYIEISLGITETSEKLPTPWKAILTSLPVWALLITQSAQSWGFWMLLTKIPSYMKSVLGFDIKKNGVISSLPYLTAWVLSFPVSYISDVCIKKNIVSTQTSRKLCNTIGQWGPAVALIALGYFEKDQSELAVLILIIAVGSNIAVYCGHHVNHMDMSPNFAGSLMGLTNAAANVCGILAPLVAGVIIDNPANVLQWRSIFFLSAAIYILGNLFFVLFGNCSVQKWNDPIRTEKDDAKSQVPEIALELPSVRTIKDVEKAEMEKVS